MDKDYHPSNNKPQTSSYIACDGKIKEYSEKQACNSYNK